MYVLWLVGELGTILAPLANNDVNQAIGALIKIPPILCDIAIGYVLYRIVLAWRNGHADAQRLALIAAAIYVFNPVTWYDSAIWGQTDSVGTLLLLLSVWALIRGNSEGASVLAVLAALVKPQFGVVALPLVGIVLLRRHLFRPDDIPQQQDPRPATSARLVRGGARAMAHRLLGGDLVHRSARRHHPVLARPDQPGQAHGSNGRRLSISERQRL